MDRFLAAQACNPFDPTAMLIQADHLEEIGDAIGAEALRGLVANGFPSLHALALEATTASPPQWPDHHLRTSGTYFPHSLPFDGSSTGHGDGDSFGLGDRPGMASWRVYGDGQGDEHQSGRGNGGADAFELHDGALGRGHKDGIDYGANPRPAAIGTGDADR